MRIEVKAQPKAGFYRAGRFWPNTPTEADVDADTLEILERERRLQVKRLDGKAAKPKDEGAGATAPNPAGGQPATVPPLPKVPDGEGTPLPEDFPARDKLLEAGFGTLESLAGVTHQQLVAHKLSVQASKAVRDAIAKLSGTKE